MADEKEIHNKLNQIMDLIGGESPDDDEHADDIISSEEEFTRKMAEEVYEESLTGSQSDDLDLYQIEADELVDSDYDLDTEIDKLAIQYFLNEDVGEEEEVKGDVMSELERER